MADISKISLPSGTTYNIKDSQARDDIALIKQQQASGGQLFLGTTTTALSDHSTTNPINIGGLEVTAVAGNIVLYDGREFIWSDYTNRWEEFGSSGNLGALAAKDSATTKYTPAGSVSTPTITVTPSSKNIFTITGVGETPSCTLPTLTTSVSNETLSIGWASGSFSAGSVPTREEVSVVDGIASATSTKPTFTGTEDTITVS